MLLSRPVFCRLVLFPIDALLTLMLYVVRGHLRTPGAEAQFVGLVEATGSTAKNKLEDVVFRLVCCKLYSTMINSLTRSDIKCS